MTSTRWAGKPRLTSKFEPVAGAALIGGAAFLLLTVALRAWPATPDGLFHLYRVAALPDANPAGSYQLQAGVYRPRQALAPLLPAGVDDPRVDVGVLKVSP